MTSSKTDYYYSVGNCEGGYRVICEVDSSTMYYHFNNFGTDRNAAVMACDNMKKSGQLPSLDIHWSYLMSVDEIQID